MGWWIVIIGIAAILVAIALIENGRGSKGASGGEDRHLNAQDKRNGPGPEWGTGGGA